MGNSKGKGNRSSPARNLAQLPEIVKIKLDDGNEYELQPLSLNMMVELEKKFEESFQKLFEKGNAEYIRYLVYLRLRKNYPNLTEERIGELITVTVLAELYKQIIG